jgi:hypothetical protein
MTVSPQEASLAQNKTAQVSIKPEETKIESGGSVVSVKPSEVRVTAPMIYLN